MYAKLGSNGGLSKNFHGVGICPLSKILASKFQSDFENLYFVENHTRDLCQTKLFACPIGNLAFKQRVIERGNPFKFAHKLLTKFVKGVLQSCQICWHFSLSLLHYENKFTKLV
jgi:hypothetical protein